MLYCSETDHNDGNWEEDPVAVGRLVGRSAEQQKGSQKGWIPVDGLNHGVGHHERVGFSRILGDR